MDEDWKPSKRFSVSEAIVWIVLISLASWWLSSKTGISLWIALPIAVVGWLIIGFLLSAGDEW